MYKIVSIIAVILFITLAALYLITTLKYRSGEAVSIEQNSETCSLVQAAIEDE